MRMTGVGSGLGFVSESGRRAVNGDSIRTTMIPVGSAQPIRTPSYTTATPAAAPTAATSISSPSSVVQPVPNLANDIINVPIGRPIPFEGARRSPGQTPPATIRPGAGATSGSGTSGAAAYGPTEYYGAPDGATDKAASAAAKPGLPVLPISLLLWALFGT